MDDVNLSYAKLMNSMVDGTSLKNANLYKADLTGAYISADFQQSNLRGAIMLCKGIEEANFQGAIFDVETIWPDGFDPIKKGAVLVEYKYLI